MMNPYFYLKFKNDLCSWFDRFILAVILTNCTLLAFEDPEVVNEAFEYTENVFLIIFTIEAIIKIIAMGFCFQEFSYLWDFWNVVNY